MIWLAWRQFRVRALVAGCAVVGLALLVVLTRANLAHVYDSSVATCKHYGDCSQATSTFLSTGAKLQVWLGIVVIAVPGLIGIFWGVPLVASELEAGTYRVAWTQSVTRTRWVVTKLVVVGLATVAVAGVVAMSVTWWSSLFDRVNADEFSVFDARDVVPIAYAAFGFALGGAIGTMLRRTLPAMALTLVGFVSVRLAVYEWIRPRFLPALRAFSPVYLPTGNDSVVEGFKGMNPGDWIVSEQTVSPTGKLLGSIGAFGGSHRFSLSLGPGLGLNVGPSGVITLSDRQVCPNSVPTSALPSFPNPPSPKIFSAMQECLNRLHIRDLYIYQPASRYWAFQWYEFTLFFLLALALAGLSIWLVRRRLA